MAAFPEPPLLPETPLPPEQVFPHYNEWIQVYKQVRDLCAFGDAAVFISSHPGTINNKGGRSGSTILHQAVFWGVDVDIITILRDLGADPTVLNNNGESALDLAQNDTKRQQMQAIFEEVFGADDSDVRQVTLQAAKMGNFLTVMNNLRQRPYLVNMQNQHNGWSVMHQVAFHGGSTGLVAALTSFGASWDLRTKHGNTPAMILERMHPNSTLVIPGRVGATPLEVGMEALLHSRQGTTRVQIESLSADHAVVRSGDVTHRDIPLWRLSAPKVALSEDDVQDLAGIPCSICAEPVPPQWKVAPDCHGEDHPMCGECTATFLWSQFTTPRLPIRCGLCESEVDLENISTVIGRALFAAWPPGRSSGHPCTEISWQEFVHNVQEKIHDGQHVEDNGYKLELLRECVDVQLDYCHATAPSTRACPSCGVLIAYAGACKHFSCALCSHRFCWLCLRTQNEHNTAQYNWSIGHTCPIQPRQTVIPGS